MDWPPTYVQITGGQLAVAVLAIGVIFAFGEFFLWQAWWWLEDRRERAAKRAPDGLPAHTAEDADPDGRAPIPREFDRRTEKRPWPSFGGTPVEDPISKPVTPLSPRPFVPNRPPPSPQWGRSSYGLHYLDCPSGLTLRPLPEILSREQALQFALEQVPPLSICLTCHPAAPLALPPPPRGESGVSKSADGGGRS